MFESVRSRSLLKKQQLSLSSFTGWGILNLVVNVLWEFFEFPLVVELIIYTSKVISISRGETLTGPPLF